MSAPPPPYPADTRAKGWRFELDYECIEQSNTWAMAEEVPMAQHALLMMWLMAWRQEPCGSLPNDEAIIRAKCRIPLSMWAGLRDVLMRGWWLADDGRLYHKTITTRVLEMIDYRVKAAKRVADYKAKSRKQRSGNALPQREQHQSNDTGTGTGTLERQPPPPSEVSPLADQSVPDDPAAVDEAAAEPSAQADTASGPCTAPDADRSAEADGQPGTAPSAADAVPKRPRKPPSKPPNSPPSRPPDVDEQTWADWLTLRRAKRAPVTATVIAGAVEEAAKAGMSLDAFLRVWCRRGTQGLEAAWIRPAERVTQLQAEPAWRSAKRLRVAAFAGAAAERSPYDADGAPPQHTAEVIDVTARRLG